MNEGNQSNDEKGRKKMADRVDVEYRHRNVTIKRVLSRCDA